MVEVGGVHTGGDETELARMGYKQELKCVQSDLSVLHGAHQLHTRRDLTLLQVRLSRID